MCGSLIHVYIYANTRTLQCKIKLNFLQTSLQNWSNNITCQKLVLWFAQGSIEQCAWDPEFEFYG